MLVVISMSDILQALQRTKWNNQFRKHYWYHPIYNDVNYLLTVVQWLAPLTAGAKGPGSILRSSVHISIFVSRSFTTGAGFSFALSGSWVRRSGFNPRSSLSIWSCNTSVQVMNLVKVNVLRITKLSIPSGSVNSYRQLVGCNNAECVDEDVV